MLSSSLSSALPNFLITSSSVGAYYNDAAISSDPSINPNNPLIKLSANMAIIVGICVGVTILFVVIAIVIYKIKYDNRSEQY